jgi:hypothetical protein
VLAHRETPGETNIFATRPEWAARHGANHPSVPSRPLGLQRFMSIATIQWKTSKTACGRVLADRVD